MARTTGWREGAGTIVAVDFAPAPGALVDNTYGRGRLSIVGYQTEA